MKIHDITIVIHADMPIWPGDPKVLLERVESMDGGDHVNVSKLSCSVHTGTHVDAPHHFLNDGRTVETLSLDVLVGKAHVLQVADEVDLVTAPVLKSCLIPEETIRLLIKTRNSRIWARGEKQFQEDFVAIAPDAADWLVARGIRLIGVDYLSVAPFRESDATHNVFLRAGVIILEGVNLISVEPGDYDLYCLPLLLAGSDGAPARAILIE